MTLDNLYLSTPCRSVDDIDLFTGGVSENPLPGARVGPLFACIIGLQFKALKYADRFYYENDVENVKFTPEQLNEIRKTLMANVICRNTEISKIHRNVFEKKTVRYVDCLQSIDTLTCRSLRLSFIWIMFYHNQFLQFIFLARPSSLVRNSRTTSISLNGILAFPKMVVGPRGDH